MISTIYCTKYRIKLLKQWIFTVFSDRRMSERNIERRCCNDNDRKKGQYQRGI